MWSDYNECSVTCGDGIRTRTRECLNGSPGSPGCQIGDEYEQKPCSKAKCIYWSPWSDYSDCSITCGSGIKTRTRECINGRPGDLGCQFGTTVEENGCSKEKCPFWSDWSAYSDCSVTCGDGRKTRTRECINGQPGILGCQFGETIDQIPCSKAKCSFWSSWFAYGDCSVTCGDGTRIRTRECINGSPGNPGCQIGDETEQVFCSKEKCIFWSTWSDYTDCSVTCGDGIRIRMRECINGSPGSYGCQIGETVQQKRCEKEKCGSGFDIFGLLGFMLGLLGFFIAVGVNEREKTIEKTKKTSAIQNLTLDKL